MECPQCGSTNQFWGIKNPDGFVEEHYGRRCKAAFEDPHTGAIEACGYLFRFKRCDQCGTENDISARVCKECQALLVDPDKKLKEAMALKDAHVMKVDSMMLKRGRDRKGADRLEVEYYDADANMLKEFFYLDSEEKRQAFYLTFARVHLRVPEKKHPIRSVDDVVAASELYRPPMYLIARKRDRFWAIREKIF